MGSKSVPPDNEQRRRILEDLDTTMLVEAAAGTGKTTSMVGRMVALLREGKCEIDTLAAVTFTRKAAAELRARFQIDLERAAREARGKGKERLVRAEGRVERCFIGTIHSFCARLLRERPIEAGIDLAFEEMEDEEDLRLREEAWSQYVARLFAEDDGVLTELRELGLEVGQLRKSFVQFAKYPDVESWPAPEVEMGSLDGPRKTLEAYVGHMESLIPTFPVDRGTDTLMPTYERVARLARNRDLSRPAELLDVLAVFNPKQKTTQKFWPGGQKQGKQESVRWVDFAGNTAQPLVRRWLEKRYATVVRVLSEAVSVHDRLRAESGRLNYQDLLLNAARLLCDKPQIRRYFRARFTHLLVDEFQDTDPIQARVMMFLTATDPSEREWQNCKARPGSLFVVGDPKQSIYRFRRADIVTYNQVKQIIADTGGAVVSLTTNFRTLGEIVGWGNEIFDHAFPAEADRYSPAARRMEVGRQSGCSGDLAGVKVIKIPEEHWKKETSIAYDSDFIARYVRDTLDARLTVPRCQKELDAGVPVEVNAGDFMIVTWGKKQLAEYARKLQDLGVPHQVTGGSALGQVEELGLLADCLAAVTEPENPVALVSVLRGGLFGLSDEDLYAFKRAGGRFSYRLDAPAGLDSNVSQPFEEAFQRLRRYDVWLRRLPPVAAVERIAGDLGLPMRALANQGGNVQAGSIAKAFQMLRAAGSELYSLADVVARLRELIDQNAEFDGIPARPYDEPVVRLMNLHKVKGLEAPVVFLANPTGKWNPPVTLHVDRAGEKAQGYMAVYEESSSYHSALLACPADWERLSAEEQQFADAEKTRLLYVAATRAGTQLVVTRKDKRNDTNYWGFFAPHLNECEALSEPGPGCEVAAEVIEVGAKDLEAAAGNIVVRWEAVEQATYATAAAKEVTVAGGTRQRRASSGEHGTEWGTVIHLLLEAAMVQPEADLEQLARGALQEHGLDTDLVGTALETVSTVTGSEVWARAKRSQKTLVEVPFARCLPPEAMDSKRPTVLRGVIDLAFQEPDGWVLVDYKTEQVTEENQSDVVEKYKGQVNLYAQCWEQLVEEQVSERGLFFTTTREYVTV